MCRRNGPTQGSNHWKLSFWVFQSLETFRYGFPIIGNFSLQFSNHWKPGRKKSAQTKFWRINKCNHTGTSIPMSTKRKTRKKRQELRQKQQAAKQRHQAKKAPSPAGVTEHATAPVQADAPTWIYQMKNVCKDFYNSSGECVGRTDAIRYRCSLIAAILWP